MCTTSALEGRIEAGDIQHETDDRAQETRRQQGKGGVAASPGLEAQAAMICRRGERADEDEKETKTGGSSRWALDLALSGAPPVAGFQKFLLSPLFSLLPHLAGDLLPGFWQSTSQEDIKFTGTPTVRPHPTPKEPCLRGPLSVLSHNGLHTGRGIPLFGELRVQLKGLESVFGWGAGRRTAGPGLGISRASGKMSRVDIEHLLSFSRVLFSPYFFYFSSIFYGLSTI